MVSRVTGGVEHCRAAYLQFTLYIFLVLLLQEIFSFSNEKNKLLLYSVLSILCYIGTVLEMDRFVQLSTPIPMAPYFTFPTGSNVQQQC